MNLLHDFFSKILFLLSNAFAHFIAGKAANRNFLTNHSGHFLLKDLYCLGIILDVFLLKKAILFIELGNGSLYDTIKNLLRLAFIQGFVTDNFCLFINRILRNILAGY